MPDSNRSNRGPDRPPRREAERVYLDTSVFADDTSRQALAKHLLPHLIELWSRQPELQVVLPAAVVASVRVQANEGQPLALAVQSLLGQLDLEQIGPAGADARNCGAAICSRCVEQRDRLRQAVYTQDREFAARVTSIAQA